MKLTYGVKDKPKFGQLIVFALQQLLAILAAQASAQSSISYSPASKAPYSSAPLSRSSVQ